MTVIYMRERKVHWPAVMEGGKPGKTLCPANHGFNSGRWKRVTFTYAYTKVTCQACIAALARRIAKEKDA